MRASGREETPSPLLFLVALPLAVLLAAGALLLLPDKPDDTVEYAEGPTPSRSGPGRPALRVVAIGSSLVQSAVDPAAVEASAAARGRAVRLRRVTCVGTRVDWVEPLLADLAKDPPGLLLVEAELLAWRVERPGGEGEEAGRTRRPRNAAKGGLGVFRHRRGYASYWLVGEMRRSLGLGAEVVRGGGGAADPNRFADRVVDLLGAAGARHGFDAEGWSRRLADVRPRGPASLAGIFGALGVLEQRGCRVVFLPMGRGPAAEAIFPADLSRAFAAFLDELSSRGFAVEREGPRFEQRLYVDAAHLGAEGRKRFSEWLAVRIPHWTEER